MFRRLKIALAFMTLACIVAASADPIYEPLKNYIVPTMPAGTSNNTAASTAFVQQAVRGGAGGGTSSSIAVGSTGVTGGTNGFVLYDANGTLGAYDGVHLTALCQLYTTTLRGCVPPPGNTSMVLFGSGWAPLPPTQTALVQSVFGRIGNVVASTGDYNFTQISGNVLPTQLPVFSTTLVGAVPPSTGNRNDVLRGDGTWGPDVGGNASSVFGRTGDVIAQTGDYNFGQIAGTVLPGQLPVFTATTIGAVPASGGNPNFFLSADGTFKSAGGVNTVFGRIGPDIVSAVGDYSFSQISGVAVPSQLPIYAGSDPGAVPAAVGTSDKTLFFLREDGAWAQTPGGSGTGTIVLGTTPIGGGANTNVLFNNNGFVGEYTLPQLTGLLTVCGTTAGTVPAPPNPADLSTYLRSDCTWTTPPGGTSAVLTVGQTPIVDGENGNIPFNNMGVVGELSPADLTTKLSVFSATANGLVPLAGSATGTWYLGADVTWHQLPDTGVVSWNGRTGVVAPAPNDYSFTEIAGTVLPDQLPIFNALQAGAVPASSGNAINFLNAAGAWTPITLGPQGAFTVLGNDTSTDASPMPLSQAQLTALVNQFTPTLAGTVPQSGGGTVNYLRADGQWANPVAPANLPIFTTTAPGAVPASGTNPTAVLHADGSWSSAPQRLVTASGAITSADAIINTNIGSAGQILTLPDAATMGGNAIMIKDVGLLLGGPGATAVPYTVQPAAGQTIDNQGAYQQSVSFGYVRLVPTNDGVTPASWTIQ